jgi:hypothetical protein
MAIASVVSPLATPTMSTTINGRLPMLSPYSSQIA